MVYLFLALGCGILFGYKNWIKEEWQAVTAKIFNIAFFALLIFLGGKITTNSDVVANLGTIGLKALVFAILSGAGAVLLTFFSYEFYNSMFRKPETQTHKVSMVVIGNGENSLKMALIPVVALCAGGIGGYFLNNHLVLNYTAFVMFFLDFMLFSIGLEIGRDRQNFGRIKSMGWSALLMPFSSLIGSILGAIIAGVLCKISLPVYLAIGVGSGFYSITGPLVASTFGAEAGALALLANFFREIMTLTLIPFIALAFKHNSLIAVGGATTMDSTLPVIVNSLGSESALFALTQGIVLTFVVPVLVTLIVSF
ncbi:lysine exporter LysO family protein [Bacillota bacterium LX-D]|nr:lysine exporter LysO family protein [Bacillota bacterium LX-D]